MLINTKELSKGIININDKPIRVGMLIAEIENILSIKLKRIKDNVGYDIFKEFNNDDKTIVVYAWFNDGKIKELALDFSKFKTRIEAKKYLDSWLKNNSITDWYSSDASYNYYKTETGVLVPIIISNDTKNTYEIRIKLINGKRPERKFKPIKQNKNNSVNFAANNSAYKVQKVPYEEIKDLPHLGNYLGNGPLSISKYNNKYNEDSRIEIMYFYISKIENNNETIMGIAEFTYLAMWEAYKSSNIYLYITKLTVESAMDIFTINKIGCSKNIKKEISPYILIYKKIHNEMPENNLEEFKEDEICVKEFFKSVMQLTSKYVNIPEEDLTLMSISDERERFFPHNKRREDQYINYLRLPKGKNNVNSKNN